MGEDNKKTDETTVVRLRRGMGADEPHNIRLEDIERLLEKDEAAQARIKELEAALKAALDILGHPDDRTVQALWDVLSKRK